MSLCLNERSPSTKGCMLCCDGIWHLVVFFVSFGSQQFWKASWGHGTWPGPLPSNVLKRWTLWILRCAQLGMLKINSDKPSSSRSLSKWRLKWKLPSTPPPEPKTWSFGCFLKATSCLFFNKKLPPAKQLIAWISRLVRNLMSISRMCYIYRSTLTLVDLLHYPEPSGDCGPGHLKMRAARTTNRNSIVTWNSMVVFKTALRHERLERPVRDQVCQLQHIETPFCQKNSVLMSFSHF